MFKICSRLKPWHILHRLTKAPRPFAYVLPSSKVLKLSSEEGLGEEKSGEPIIGRMSIFHPENAMIIGDHCNILTCCNCFQCNHQVPHHLFPRRAHFSTGKTNSSPHLSPFPPEIPATFRKTSHRFLIISDIVPNHQIYRYNYIIYIYHVCHNYRFLIMSHFPIFWTSQAPIGEEIHACHQICNIWRHRF